MASQRSTWTGQQQRGQKVTRTKSRTLRSPARALLLLNLFLLGPLPLLGLQSSSRAGSRRGGAATVEKGFELNQEQEKDENGAEELESPSEDGLKDSMEEKEKTKQIMEKKDGGKEMGATTAPEEGGRSSEAGSSFVEKGQWVAQASVSMLAKLSQLRELPKMHPYSFCLQQLTNTVLLKSGDSLGILVLCCGLALVVFIVGGMVFFTTAGFMDDDKDHEFDKYGKTKEKDSHPQSRGGSHSYDESSDRHLMAGPGSGGSRGAPTQQDLKPGAVEDALCPSLLVPSGSEFVFVIKEVIGAGRQEEAFNVVDMKGVALTRVVVSETGPHPGILLQTLREKKPLCFVNTMRCFESDPKRRSLEICRPTGEVFGTMARDGSGGRYGIWHANTRLKLLTFHGDFRDHAINVVNGQNQLICATEKCTVEFDSAPCVQVRVAPDVDAGLVMCGLFGIDKLEGRERR